MHATYPTAKGETRAAASHRRRRWAWLIGAPVAFVVIAAVVLVGHFLDEPLRRRLEVELNQSMKGYTVKLPRLDFHPLGFSLTLHGLTVRQQAFPKPPVIVIDELHAGVHWRALLHLRLVADFELDDPRLHINRRQLLNETEDKVPVDEKGWQEALEKIYPLKINEFRVNNLSLTYVDEDPKRPLQITKGNLVATNIRNVRSPDRTYPSPVRVDAVVFDRGKLVVIGDANFLAEPHVGMKVDIDLRDVPLEKLRPVAIHASLYVTGGVLREMRGDVEYAPKVQSVHLRMLRIDDIAVDYVHSQKTAKAEAARVETVKEVAQEVAEKPTTSAEIDTLTMRNATIGFVNEATEPDYRVFLAGANLDVRGYSTKKDAEAIDIDLTGFFNGSGRTRLDARVLPTKSPNVEMALQIDDVDMRTMNDLFRANGNFDVAGGRFSFYSELGMRDGKVAGYVKPLFEDLNVYDTRQDSKDPIFQQLYEGVVGSIGELLENRRDKVATQAKVRGRVDQPETSTLEIVVNLIRNAFFEAIIPGLENAVREAGRAPPSAEPRGESR